MRWVAAVLVMALGLGGCAQWRFADAERVVLDLDSTEADALAACVVLKSEQYKSTPGFWQRVINDPEMRPERRRRATMMLMERHMVPGLTLREVAPVITGCAWHRREGAVQVVDAMAGMPPFPDDPRGVLVHVAPMTVEEDALPTFYFLQIEGRIFSQADLLKALAHPQESALRRRRVTHYVAAVNDPADAVLLRRK